MDQVPDADGRCVEPTGPTEQDYVEAANAGDPSTCDPPQGVGNPIHVGTGNKYQREVDIAGWSPFAAALVRHYNSQTETVDGRHWRHTWQRRLAVDGFEYRDASGTLQRADETVALIRPDGRTLVFYRTGAHQLAATAAETPDDIPAVGTDQYPLDWTGSAWRYRAAGGGAEYYDDEGKLVRLVDASGYTQTVTHDGEGRVATVADDYGRTLTFHYDTAGRLAEVIDPAGEAYTYSYDSDGRLVSVTDPGGATRTYHYGESGAPADALTGITDANGARFATWQYDDQGRAVTSEHAGGAGRVEITYLDDDRARVTEADGGERTYTITTVNGRRLATAIDGDACSSCSRAQSYQYNDQGLVTQKTDRNGNVTTYQYNGAGLETRRTEAVGTPAERTVTTTWDTDLRQPLTITEAGQRTEYTYDDRGRVLSKTVTDTASGASRTTSYTYHPDSGGVPGRLASVDGPRSDVADVTHYEYDADGNRVEVTNALGHVTAITGHDAYGRPTELVGPNGLTPTLSYDASGRLIERNVGGRITAFAYDAAGNLTRVTQPDGSSLAYTYDAAHRVTAIEDEDGHRIEYTLDAQGRRTEQHVTAASGQVVREHRRVFDDLGRLIERIGAQGQRTRHAYDANGNRTRTTDPAGDITARAFDALDRLIRQTDAAGGITGYRYDAHDRITAVTDPNGNVTRYTYDGLGNRTEVDSPDAGVTTYSYDAAGNVIEKTDARGQTTTYSYDALNRRTEAVYGDGSTATFEWDSADHGIGRLAEIDEASGTTAWAYNRHGDITRRSQTADGVTLTTRHEYDGAGRKTATVYPSGRRVTYSHDADEVTAIAVDGTTVLEGAHDRPFGPIAGWIWGDGEQHTRSYDRDGRLTQHSVPGGERQLSYSLDGQITGIAGPTVDNDYGYDAVDRLIRADGADHSRRYSYDAGGNRLTKTADGATTNYTIASASNRLLAASGADDLDNSYDAAGNLTGDGEHSYRYNARGRLSQVDGGDTATYRYNALGQRVHKHARLPLPDYARLATEAEDRAARLAQQASDLRSQAQAKQAEAASAQREAATARRELNRARAEAERAERTAQIHSDRATRWQQTRDRFAARAQQYRDRTTDTDPGPWELRNRLYGRLAELHQNLAERFGGWAQEARTRAEEAEQRQATAEAEAEAAQQRLTQAEQTARQASAEAQSLRAEATEKRRAAAEARAQAAEYQRLANNPPPRPTLEERYVYSESGQLIGIYGPGGQPIREFVHLGRILVAVATKHGLHYVHGDHLGTPRAVSEPDGPVVWRWPSDPYGTTAADEDPDGDGIAFTLNRRFPGQYLDAETGGHYNYFRTYAPSIGRYTTSDPIGLGGGLNSYRYANADPIRHADPKGLAPSMGDRLRKMLNAKPGKVPDMVSIVKELGDAAGDAVRCREHFCRLQKIPSSHDTQEWCIMNATGDPMRCADFCGAITHWPKGIEKFKKECMPCKE